MKINFKRIFAVTMVLALLLSAMSMTAYATGDAAATENQGSGLWSTIIMVAVFGLIIYFIMIRPEKKRKKQEEELRSSLQEGDKITTIGGIVGKIIDIDGENIVIETSKDRVRVELKKWAVGQNDTATENAQKARAEAQAKAKERAEQRKKEKEEAKRNK